MFPARWLAGLGCFVSGCGGGWGGLRDSGAPTPSQVCAGAGGRDAKEVRADLQGQLPHALISNVSLDDAVPAAPNAFDYQFTARRALNSIHCLRSISRKSGRWELLWGPAGAARALCFTQPKRSWLPSLSRAERKRERERD